MAVKRRTLVVNVAFGLYFAFGSTVLPWTAYYIANWRFFAYITAVPMMSVFITPWILPESARYDILHQSLTEAIFFSRNIKRCCDNFLYILNFETL